MSIGWGIIGTGIHADRFMGPAISMANNTRLIAVYDVDQRRAGEFASKHGAQRIYDSFEK